MASFSPKQQSEYNILFVGETGVGKSLLINAFANFVLYQSLDEAKTSGVRCLIPTRFIISDDDYADHHISVGVDDNECMDMARSGTLSCKSYVFTLPDFKIRLIDSAGIAATQGRQVDTKNIEDILEFINHYDALHAIAIVFNSNQTRITDQFKYCFDKLMSNLDRSAISNIVFLLTASESSGYKPGNVREPLQSCLNQLKHKQLQLSKDTMYCFDNNWFRYLLAGQNGVDFNDEDREHYDKSWSKSFDEYGRLLRYVIGDQNHSGLIPHNVKDSTTNEARLFIIKLRPILQVILQNIELNKEQIRNTIQLCDQCDEEINNLRLRSTMNFFDVKIVQLQQPRVVCASDKCRKDVRTEDKVTFIYPKVCCDGCRILFGRRLFCQVIELVSGNCRDCQCHVREHQRVHVNAEQVLRSKLNPDVVQNIRNVASAKKDLKQNIVNLNKMRDQYEDEKKLITMAMDRFAKFIEQNAIAPPPVGDDLTSLPGSTSSPEVVSKEEVFVYKKSLLQLEMYGETIRMAVDAINSSEQKEVRRKREVMVAQVKGVVKGVRKGIANYFGYVRKN